MNLLTKRLVYLGLFILPAAFLTTSVSPGISEQDLSTTAERSNWQKTGRYEEVVHLCSQFEKAFPGQASCRKYGVTPEGRPMLALIASADGTLESEQAKTRGRPVVFFQAGIHPGEIDGKDAGFKVLREILKNRALPDLLKKVTLVFVPVFNIDGHERFGPNNRPNQVGPEEMGWRTTGQNLNLNRDYAKAEAPEMAAQLRLLNEWDPVLYLDLHVTDGAEFQHEVAVLIDPTEQGPRAMLEAGVELRDQVMSRLEKLGHLPLSFYPSFNQEDNPASGFSVTISPPRFSQGYWGLHNRIGVLVETHSWKDYPTRVRATEDTLLAFFESAGKNGADWLLRAHSSDSEAKALSGTKVALAYGSNGHSQLIEYQGYSYKRVPSDISGQLWTIYDPKRPEVWHIPLFDQTVPTVTVQAPGSGYVIAAAHADWLGEKLKLHGIQFTKITEAQPRVSVGVFRSENFSFSKTPFEGRTRLSIKGEWTHEKLDIPVGSLFVPIAQPLSRLVMNLLEPLAPDSLLGWGFFNGVYEKKEYMESYVAEKVAREMLARDSSLRQEFERRLKTDPAFAKSPDARLEFFHRRHPSWDQRYALYPVYRLE